MKFSGPIRAHEHSVKTNPKPTLIADSILLGIVITLLFAINILVIVLYEFTPLLVLSWVLLGGIAAWLAGSIVKCAKNLKKKRTAPVKK